MKALEITNKLKHFINNKINIISKTNPLISFTQPFITRIIDNKSSKIIEFLNMFADENGEIDINGIVDDVINKLSTVDPFTIDLMSITKLEIGGGKVKIGIPLSDKAISLDEKDLLSFKEGISNIV